MTRISLEDRRQQFIEATARLIASKGEAQATTRRIAEAANAPLSALHYCFNTKDDLLQAVYDHLSRDFARDLPPLPESISLAETVHRHLHRIWDRIISRPYEQVTTMEVLLRAQRVDQKDPDAVETAFATNRQMFAGWVGSTSTIFREAAEAEGLTPPISFESVARFAVAGIDGIAVQALADPKPHNYEEQVDMLAGSIMAMLTGETVALTESVIPAEQVV